MAEYSHSKLSCFENCPRQYYYHYVERVEIERKEGVEAFMGSRVHETLEKIYQDKKMSRDDSLDDVLAYYDDNWQRNWHENVRIVKKEYKEKDYYNTGKRCVTDYYKRYAPFDDSTTIALEKMLSFDIDGYRMRGYVDRLSQRKDGTYEIHDYKTGNSLPDQARVDEDRQLALYHIGLKQLWDDTNNTELVWHYLAFDKELKSKRSEKQLEALKNDIVSLIKTVEAALKADNFPAHESQLCKWCDYQDLCPNYKHLYVTEQLSLNKFMKEPGVKLVNAYRDLKEQEAFVKDELEQLKAAVLKYAKDNNVEIIRGSDRKLRVKVEDYEDVPTKSGNPDEYAKLEELLKKSDYWDEISSMNASLLRAALDSNVFKTDFQNKIAKLLVEKHSESVRLSKLKDE